jgi:hypothetical protein
MKINIFLCPAVAFVTMFSFAISAGAVTTSLAPYPDMKNAWVDVRSFPSLAACVSSMSTDGKEILITDNVRLDTSITIPKNIALHFVKGGRITVTKGKRLTIDCHIEADLGQQIFDGAGEVVLGPNADHKVSICWKGAKSSNSDNAPFIQWALDQMSAIQGDVIVPLGDYRYASALNIKSNTSIEGEGRKFVTTLHPVNCPAITMDGTSVEGSWIFRVKIRNLTIYGNEAANSQGDKLVFLNNAYNVDIEDVWIFNQNTSTGLFIKNCNDVVISNLIVYGLDTGSSRKGIYSENSTVKMITPDLENLYTGIQCSGGGSVDIISPYMERCIIGYRHVVTTGTTRIFGGTISSINGYCVDVRGDHLYVYGTDLSPYQGEKPGGPGIISGAESVYGNVFFYDIPKVARAGFFDRGTNWLNLHLAGTMPIAGHTRGSLDFTKELTNHAAADVIEFNNLEYANCELRIYSSLQKSRFISKVYTFAVAFGTSSPIRERVEVNSGDEAVSVVLTVSAKNISGNRCRVSVRADCGGAWQGKKIPLNLQLNYQVKTTESGKILLL